MHAHSYFVMPARGLYDESIVGQIRESAKKSHIYLIGLTAKIDLTRMHQAKDKLITVLTVDGHEHEIEWELEPGDQLVNDDGLWYVLRANGKRAYPSELQLAQRLHQKVGMRFEIQYIGQAYGKDGSRNALDRLMKHETLQKISLKGIPQNRELMLLMLEVIDANRTLTVIRPDALDRSQGSKRISRGIDKLFDTTVPERITLYEASLIRYFQPLFNKEFKDSFPSTNMKVLADCYEKDFAGVVAEINFDDLPFYLCSTTVAPSPYVIAKHSLHSAAERNIFFDKGI